MYEFYIDLNIKIKFYKLKLFFIYFFNFVTQNIYEHK